MKGKKILICMVFMMLLVMVPSNSVKAASYIKLKVNGSVQKYSGTMVKASIDGKHISVANAPGITVNGTALLSYQDIFRSGLGAACSYNAQTKTITIKQYGNTVKLTLGSTIAYINGNRTTISVAPRKVYYYAAKTSKILVPSRFVAEALGYTYNWSSSTSTAVMKSPYALYYNKAWHVYKGTKGKATLNGASVSVSKMPVVIFSNIAFIQASRIFGGGILDSSYHYDSSAKEITIQNDVACVRYQLNGKVAYVNGTSYTLKEAPRMIKDNVSNKNYVMVPAKFTAEALGYQYQWNKNTHTSQIVQIKKTIWTWNGDVINETSACSNRLEQVLLEEQDGEESIRFIGTAPIVYSTVFEEKERILKVTVSDLKNVVTAMGQELENSSNVSDISISDSETGVVVFSFVLHEGSSFYESQSGNEYSLHFVSSETEVTENSITLMIPDGVTFDEITQEDCYYNKQFKIRIPGNHVSYYQNLSEELPEGVTKVTCSSSNGDTVLTFHTSRILGFRLSGQDTSFTIEVGKPSEMYSSIVVLDAGHGGTDPGCMSNGHKEKDINFAILYRYCKEYFNDPDSPVKAYWTRTTDTKISLNDRAAFAKSVGADIFISLHQNSATASANGTETYYSTSNNATNDFGINSSKLAHYFQKNWSGQLGLSTTRGVRTAGYVVVKNNTVPAILIELGFMTNSKDIGIIGKTANQKKAASTFYDTVCSFFEEYPTGR